MFVLCLFSDFPILLCEIIIEFRSILSNERLFFDFSFQR